MNYRSEVAFLLEDLRSFAEEIAELGDLAKVHSLARAQLHNIEAFEKAEARADAEALVWIKAKAAKLGIDDDTVNMAFPPETCGRLVPPFLRFPESAEAVA